MEADLAHAVRWAAIWERIENFAFLIVVIALAVEFMALRLGTPYKEKIDHAREVAIAAANERAANANERAEKSEASRIAMLEQLKPRDLKVEQIDAFAGAIRGKFKEIHLAALGDSDAMQYMNGFAEAVRRSGATPLLFLDRSKGEPARFWSAWDFPVPLNGVAVYAKADDMQVILEALVKIGVAAPSGIVAPNAQFKDVPTPTIFVGLKPVPFSQFPSYAAPPELRDWQKKNPPAWEHKE